MGLSPFHASPCKTSSCTSEGKDKALAVDPKFGNPNPKRFEIKRHKEYDGWTVVEVVYPDAKNYEGRKILLYHCRYAQIAAQKELDPHFCDDGSHLSPFARFEPTENGWRMANAFAAAAL
jgi:hypothetical protein